MIELTFLKELMLIIQANQRSDICHCWYFLNKDFKFHPNVYNRSHDLLVMCMNLVNIAILSIKGSDCRCIISGISKSEAVKLLQNIGLTEKSGTL